MQVIARFLKPPYYLIVVIGGFIDILLVRQNFGINGTAIIQTAFFIPLTIMLAAGKKLDFIVRKSICDKESLVEEWAKFGSFYKLMAIVYFLFGLMGILLLVL